MATFLDTLLAMNALQGGGALPDVPPPPVLPPGVYLPSAGPDVYTGTLPPAMPPANAPAIAPPPPPAMPTYPQGVGPVTSPVRMTAAQWDAALRQISAIPGGQGGVRSTVPVVQNIPTSVDNTVPQAPLTPADLPQQVAPYTPGQTLPAGPIVAPQQAPAFPPYAPLPAFDPTMIARFQALAPPVPEAPPAPTRLQRIAAVIGGAGAGLQGGPLAAQKYLENLQQPQREYEQRMALYNQARTQLGVMGLNAAAQQQMAQQQFTNQGAIAQWQNEVNQQNMQAQFAQQRALALQNQAEIAQREAARQQEENKRNLANNREKYATQLVALTKYYGQGGISNDLAQKFAANALAPVGAALGMAPPPQLTEEERNITLPKVEAQIAELQARQFRETQTGEHVGAIVGRTGLEKAVNDFEAAKATYASLLTRQGQYNPNDPSTYVDPKQIQQARTKMDVMFGRLAPYKDKLELGYGVGGFPYQKPGVTPGEPLDLRNQQTQQPVQQSPTPGTPGGPPAVGWSPTPGVTSVRPGFGQTPSAPIAGGGIQIMTKTDQDVTSMVTRWNQMHPNQIKTRDQVIRELESQGYTIIHQAVR